MFAIMSDYYSDKRSLVPRRLEEENNVDGKIVVITGANKGLGKATALELAKKGATVILACRDMRKASNAINEISAKTSNGKLIAMRLDLGSLASVENFSRTFKEDFQSLHILINNAGVANRSGVSATTADGFELHIGVNHLGHFLLTILLLPHLKKGYSSRIVCVSSTLHLTANLDVDDLMLEKIDPNDSRKPKPYGNSKLANALFALELSKRLRGSGITTYSLCPGLVQTEIFSSNSQINNAIAKVFLKSFGQSPNKGCETILYCALSKRCAFESGKMYRFGKVWEEATIALELNSAKARRLWEKSEELIRDLVDL